MLDHSPYVPRNLWNNPELVTMFIKRSCLETGYYRIQNPKFFHLNNDPSFLLYLINQDINFDKINAYFGSDFFSQKDMFLDILRRVDTHSKYEGLEVRELRVVSFGALFYELKKIIDLFGVTVIEDDQCVE